MTDSEVPQGNQDGLGKSSDNPSNEQSAATMPITWYKYVSYQMPNPITNDEAELVSFTPAKFVWEQPVWVFRYPQSDAQVNGLAKKSEGLK